MARVYTSHIASYKAIVDHLMVTEAHWSDLETIQQALGDTSLLLKAMFLGFLQGKGVPCPNLFSAISVHFPSVIDLSHIEEDGFWAKHFCWASTGTYKLELDASDIQVNPACFTTCRLLLTQPLGVIGSL